MHKFLDFISSAFLSIPTNANFIHYSILAQFHSLNFLIRSVHTQLSNILPSQLQNLKYIFSRASKIKVKFFPKIFLSPEYPFRTASEGGLPLKDHWRLRKKFPKIGSEIGREREGNSVLCSLLVSLNFSITGLGRVYKQPSFGFSFKSSSFKLKYTVKLQPQQLVMPSLTARTAAV